MKIYNNGMFVSGNELKLGIDNRAFLYGDGLFETMLGYRGEVKLLRSHLERITGGLAALSIEPPKDFELNNSRAIIQKLFMDNNLTGYARVRLYAWRAPGGAYAPEHNAAQVLITILETDKPRVLTRKLASFSSDVKNCLTPLSRYKSMNAQLYVLAALEMQKKGMDDIVIADVAEHVSECLVSNIFWVKDGVVFTPSLRTGCISGVGRRAILEELKKRGTEVQQVEAPIGVLLTADCVFTSNALGLAHILQIDQTRFQPYPEIEILARIFE